MRLPNKHAYFFLVWSDLFKFKVIVAETITFMIMLGSISNVYMDNLWKQTEDSAKQFILEASKLEISRVPMQWRPPCPPRFVALFIHFGWYQNVQGNANADRNPLSVLVLKISSERYPSVVHSS